MVNGNEVTVALTPQQTEDLLRQLLENVRQNPNLHPGSILILQKNAAAIGQWEKMEKPINLTEWLIDLCARKSMAYTFITFKVEPADLILCTRGQLMNKYRLSNETLTELSNMFNSYNIASMLVP